MPKWKKQRENLRSISKRSNRNNLKEKKQKRYLSIFEKEKES